MSPAFLYRASRPTAEMGGNLETDSSAGAGCYGGVFMNCICGMDSLFLKKLPKQKRTSSAIQQALVT